MKKKQSKQSKPKPKGRKQRVAKLSASKALTLAPKPRPRKRIESVTGDVGAERWEVTKRKVKLEQTFGQDISEPYLADSRDMKDVQTDLETLAKQCDLIRDLAEEQATRLDHLEARLASAEAATKQVGAELAAQLGELERLLGGAAIPQALKNLCDQQLVAIDERMTALHSLETRVRELVKNHEV